MNKLIWYLKQLLPLQYVSEYIEMSKQGKDDQRKLTIWRMWFGMSFNVRTWNIEKG